MGWKSTMGIKKEDALKEVLLKILEANDTDLEDILEILTPNSGYNYSIVDDYDGDYSFYYSGYLGE